jgi:hypothetical protein
MTRPASAPAEAEESADADPPIAALNCAMHGGKVISGSEDGTESASVAPRLSRQVQLIIIAGAKNEPERFV